jgi:hypothetical protein
MAMAYFGNAVKDEISVNINNALAGIILSARPSLSSGGLQTLAMIMASFIIKANKDKGQFGSWPSTNRVTIQFATLRDDPNQFDVTVSDVVTGQNLYFYVFENTLVGQNELGSSVGIKIEMLQVAPKPIQGVGVT